jgi:hypothetical protein
MSAGKIDDEVDVDKLKEEQDKVRRRIKSAWRKVNSEFITTTENYITRLQGLQSIKGDDFNFSHRTVTITTASDPDNPRTFSTCATTAFPPDAASRSPPREVDELVLTIPPKVADDEGGGEVTAGEGGAKKDGGETGESMEGSEGDDEYDEDEEEEEEGDNDEGEESDDSDTGQRDAAGRKLEIR